MSLLYLFILGACLGSFLNVLSERFSFDKTIMGRSSCDGCHKTLRWFELVPIFSFLFFRAECPRCGKKISWFYPFSEIVTGVAFVLTGIFIPSPDLLILYLGVVSCLVGIFFADVKYTIIPDEFLILLSILSLFFIIQKPLDHLIAGALLSSLLYLIYAMTKGKGIGYGDVKFALVMGFLLGIQSGVLALYLSFLIGGVMGVVLIVASGKKLKSRIAFGPFMIAGIWIMLFFSQPVLDLFHRYISF